MQGIILKAISGFYYVEADEKVYECKARGRFRSEKITPLVGDRVEFTPDGDKGTVDGILPRKNELARPPVSNIDKLFIVSSAKTPSPSALLIDRLTALCAYKSIEPIILFNKNDLEDLSSWCDIYKNAGFKTISCSAKSGEGIDEIRKELKNSVSAFSGNSGAGKSSLLNILFKDLKLSVGEVSEKLGRGRHTTRHVEVYALDGEILIADTPGFSSLEPDKEDIYYKDSLADCFTDFERYASECRFADCKHIGEKGCAVCEAVKNGEIEKTRHASYLTIYEELKDLKAWNIKK